MNKYVIFFGILALVITFIYAFFSKGTAGILGVVSFFIKAIVILIIIALIGVAIYFYFFFEKKINATVEVLKNVISESILSCPDNLRDLWLSGDKEHKSVKIGRVIGYSSRQNYNVKKNCYENESIFLVSRGFLKQPAPIRCPEQYHDELQGDVKIFCNSLVKHSLYYYPNIVHLDFDVIDATIYYEGERFINLDNIGIISPLIKKAIGLGVKDLQELETKTGMEMVKELKEGKK